MCSSRHMLGSISPSPSPLFYEESETLLLKSAIQFFYRHIRFDDSTLVRMKSNEFFRLFDERLSHKQLQGVVEDVLIDSAYDTSLNHVAMFILTILHQGLFGVKTFVMAIIYLSRFKEVTKVSIHTFTWRLLFLTSLLVADKANEDKPIRLGSLAKLFPLITSKQLSELEIAFCLQTRFTFLIKPELFDSFLLKLAHEKPMPYEVDALVEGSEFVQHTLQPFQRTVPCTPQTVVKASSKAQASQTASTRSRSKQPHIFKTHIMEECSIISTPRRSTERMSPDMRGISPMRTVPSTRQRGRSASLSRVLSISSFIDDRDSSYEQRSNISTASLRRASLGSRPSTVPPPPIFDPIHKNYSSSNRRFSLGGRASPVDPYQRSHALSPSPGCIYPIRPLGQRLWSKNRYAFT